METLNLICVGRMLGTAALARTESRGGHFRLEFPEEDENFVGNLIIRREDNRCTAEFQPVPPRDRVAPPPPGEALTDLDLM
jgi:succinate dehydrogenase/fumarate reductase flavoprotein subunit